MKKNLIIIYPYKFTSFENFKFEINEYKRKYNVKILDLSFNNKFFLKSWKAVRYKKVIAPKNILELIKTLKSLIKKNTFIINLMQNENNLYTLITKFFLKKKKPVEIVLNDTAFDYVVKKNLKWFFSKILKSNFNVYKFYLKLYAFKFLNFFLIHNNQFMFFSLYKNKYIHNWDYSNSLIKKNNNKKRYVLYLDNGGPYFTGDHYHIGNKLLDFNVNKIYLSYLDFFKKIENDFNCKIIIIPHPKYKSHFKKIKTFNPFFKDFAVDNAPNALQTLSNNAFFFLSKGSTASAYAVVHKKPTICIGTDEEFKDSIMSATMVQHAAALGTKHLNIKNYKKKILKKMLKINFKKYDLYSKKFLAPNPKFLQKKNYEIISNFIDNYSS